MPLSDARKRANEKYHKEKTDEIKIRVEKGQKPEIQAHAISTKESVNAFIIRAISETMERDKGKTPATN